MEKLIELLETFEKERLEKLKSDVWKNDTISTRIWTESDITIYNKLQVISKEFGFIKWLVDNDKIDLEKLDEKSERKPQYTFIDDEGRLGFKLFEVYESLLMLLAIQENPIEFLCSVLK